jgi:hypothetical protein
MEFVKRYKWVIVGVGAVGLIVAFLLFRPDKLFVDDVVDESLEDAFAVTQAEAAPASTTTTTVASTTSPSSATDGSSDTTTTTVPPTTTTEPAGPQAIADGSFYGIDHEAEGTATVYELDGDFVLRFEDDTDIQNGPDLLVYFLPTDAYEKGDDLGEFINLGKLKGNVGGQNYELPDEYDPEIHRFVMIWCERFDVPFAASPLT